MTPTAPMVTRNGIEHVATQCQPGTAVNCDDSNLHAGACTPATGPAHTAVSATTATPARPTPASRYGCVFTNSTNLPHANLCNGTSLGGGTCNQAPRSTATTRFLHDRRVHAPRPRAPPALRERTPAPTATVHAHFDEANDTCTTRRRASRTSATPATDSGPGRGFNGRRPIPIRPRSRSGPAPALRSARSS